MRAINKQQLRSRLVDQPVGVLAEACRLPGNVNDPAEFWDLLKTGRNVSRRTPADRIPKRDNLIRGLKYGNSVEAGNFIEQDISQFDPAFFKISKSEAELIDPQQRLLLECVQECIENSGQSDMSDVGVFVGLMEKEYQSLLPENSSILAMLGSMASVVAGRINYVYDSYGPSVTLDTACSGSLAAVDLAVNAILDGKCQRAIVAGVNLILSEDGQGYRSNGKMLSRHGLCTSFDARASGYGRSDGCVVIMLELPQPNRQYLSMLCGMNINHGGRGGVSLMAPNGKAHEKLLKDMLSTNDKTIDYWEAHGTGTPVGDPIELNTLSSLLSNMPVGSAKCLLGHGEAAAGATGLLKLAMILRSDYVPPLIHFHVMNKNIELGTLFLPVIGGDQIVDSAGISSFGASGTNASLLATKDTYEVSNADDMLSSCYVIPLSAKNAKSLAALEERIIDTVKSSRNNLNDICAAISSREMYSQRTSLIVNRSGTVLQRTTGKLTAKTEPMNIFVNISHILDPHLFDSESTSDSILNHADKMIISLVKLLQGTPSVKIVPTSLRALLLVLCSDSSENTEYHRLLEDANDDNYSMLLESFPLTEEDREIIERFEKRQQLQCQHTITDRLSLLRLLSDLHIKGQNIEWDKFYPNVPNPGEIRLPNYPYNRQTIWFEPRKTVFDHYLIGTIVEKTKESTTFENLLCSLRHGSLYTHGLTMGTAVEIASVAVEEVLKKPMLLTNFKIHKVKLSEDSWLSTKVTILKSKVIEISAKIDGKLFFSCRAEQAASEPAILTEQVTNQVLFLEKTPSALIQLSEFGNRLSLNVGDHQSPYETLFMLLEAAMHSNNSWTRMSILTNKRLPATLEIQQSIFDGLLRVEVFGNGELNASIKLGGQEKFDFFNSPQLRLIERLPSKLHVEQLLENENMNEDAPLEVNHGLNISRQEIIKKLEAALKDSLVDTDGFEEETMDICQDFTDFGLDSLSLVDFLNRLNSKYFLDLELQATDIFENPTLDSLAGRIEQLLQSSVVDEEKVEIDRIVTISHQELRETVIAALKDSVAEEIDEQLLQEDLDFMELGLDSLSLVDFVYRLNRTYFPGLDIDTSDVFDSPTIDQLTMKIAEVLNEKSLLPSMNSQIEEIPDEVQEEITVENEESSSKEFEKFQELSLELQSQIDEIVDELQEGFDELDTQFESLNEEIRSSVKKDSIDPTNKHKSLIRAKIVRALEDTLIDSFDPLSDADFMELGMDSLSLVDFVNRLNTKYFANEIELFAHDIFDNPTIDSLTGFIIDNANNTKNVKTSISGSKVPKEINVIYEKIKQAIADISVEELDFPENLEEMDVMSLGLDSLAIVELVNRLNDKYFHGIELTTMDLFNCSNMKELAELLDERLQNPDSSSPIDDRETNILDEDNNIENVIGFAEDSNSRKDHNKTSRVLKAIANTQRKTGVTHNKKTEIINAKAINVSIVSDPESTMRSQHSEGQEDVKAKENKQQIMIPVIAPDSPRFTNAYVAIEGYSQKSNHYDYQLVTNKDHLELLLKNGLKIIKITKEANNELSQHLDRLLRGTTTILVNIAENISPTDLFLCLCNLIMATATSKKPLIFRMGTENNQEMALAQSFIKTAAAEKYPLVQYEWTHRIQRFEVIPDLLTKKIGENWLITGGLSGIGYTIAKWLSELCKVQGIVLISRRKPNLELEMEFKTWRTRVITMQADVSNYNSIKDVFVGLRIKLDGVIHSAGVLQDAKIERQTAASFEKAYSGKAKGLENLERLLEEFGHNPSTFLVMSSITQAFGNPGQSNYGMANACISHRMAERRRIGKAGTTIHWGNWLETGMAANAMYRKILPKVGLLGIKNEEALHYLKYAILEKPLEFVAGGFDWDTVLTNRQDLPRDFVKEGIIEREIVTSVAVPGGFTSTTTKSTVQESYSGMMEIPSSPPIQYSLKTKVEEHYKITKPAEGSIMSEKVVESIHKNDKLDKSLPAPKFSLPIYYNNEQEFDASSMEYVDILYEMSHRRNSRYSQIISGNSIAELIRKLNEIRYTEVNESATLETRVPQEHNVITKEEAAVLQDHQIRGEPIVAGAFVIEKLIRYVNKNDEIPNRTVTNVKFANAWKLENSNLNYEIRNIKEGLEVFVGDMKSCSISLKPGKEPFKTAFDRSVFETECTIDCNSENFYNQMHENGFTYCEKFQLSENTKRSKNKTISRGIVKSPFLFPLMDCALHMTSLLVICNRPNVYFVPIVFGEAYLDHTFKLRPGQDITIMSEMLSVNEKYLQMNNCLMVDGKVVFEARNCICVIVKADPNLSFPNINKPFTISDNALNLKETKFREVSRAEVDSFGGLFDKNIETSFEYRLKKMIGIDKVKNEDSDNITEHVWKKVKQAVGQEFAINSDTIDFETNGETTYSVSRKIAQLMKRDLHKTDTSIITKLRAVKNPKFNVYLSHAIGGNIFPYYAFLQIFPKDVGVYAIEFKLDCGFTNVKELVGYYAKAIAAHTGSIRPFLVGHSMGGTMSREMAHDMELWGWKIPFVVMFEGWVTAYHKLDTKKVEEFIAEVCANLPDKDVRVQKTVALAHMLWDFEFSRSDTKIYLFKSTQIGGHMFRRAVSVEMDGNGYEQVSTQPVSVCLISGDHESCIKIENLKQRKSEILEIFKDYL